MKKLTTVVLFLLIYEAGFSQSNYLQINLEIRSSQNKNHNMRISLYQDSLFYLGIKNNPDVDIKNSATWLKRDADTAIKISTGDFDKIVKLSANFSSTKILEGMHASNPIIGNDGNAVNLELVVTGDKISYSIWSPTVNTKERNLTPFLDICKEILQLAKLKPNEFL